MSVNHLTWRKVRTLNEKMGERFVCAWTMSHGRDRNWWYCIRFDGSALWVNAKDSEIPNIERPEEFYSTSTQSMLRKGEPISPQDQEWFAILRARQNEMDITHETE